MRKFLEYMFFTSLIVMVLLLFYGIVYSLLIQAGIPVTHNVPHWWIYSAVTSIGTAIFSQLVILLIDFVKWYVKAIVE